MAAYDLLGTIEHIAPGEFFVTVSAIVEEGSAPPMVETESVGSREDAHAVIAGPLANIETRLRERRDLVRYRVSTN